MAVVAPPPFKSSLDFWGSSDSAIHPVDLPEPMTDIMSYQYPPPPSQNGAEMEMPSSGYLPSFQLPPPPPSSGMDMIPSPESSTRSLDRRDSLSRNMKLNRSMSTPNVRALPVPQSAPQPQQQPSVHDQTALSLAAEKKRNKLGYHRTSVACGE
jgi:hypothetical protein